MVQLEDFTTKEVIDHLCERLIEQDKMTKKQAKKLILNALIYNCVVDEIIGQAEWLNGKEEE